MDDELLDNVLLEDKSLLYGWDEIKIHVCLTINPPLDFSHPFR